MSGFPPPPGQFQAPQQGQFLPPPGQQGGAPGMTQLNQGMANMSMQPGQGFAPPPPQPGQGFAPPPPQPGFGGTSAPPGPTGPSQGSMQAPGQGFMQPPPAPGQGFMQPPGQQPKPPGQSFQAPPPPGGQGFVPGPPAPPGQAQFQAQAPGGQAPSPFVTQPPSQGGMNRAAAPPGAVPGAMHEPAAPMFNENIDFDVKISDRLFRFSADKLPNTASQASSSKIPFGAVIRPLAPLLEDEEQIDTVQPGNAGIIRCKRCRTYINAFVSWSDHGRRWRCNICAQMNDCPSAYFCHLDEKGLRRDRYDRPELSKGIVEFVAPAEYMVRPPQEPTYFFVLDVSATAIRSGMLECAAAAIKSSLDDLPGRGRTKVGFITFDNSVHYYNLASDLSNPQMLVVSDLKELFVPLPDNLLVNLQESRSVVDTFLDSLPEMFTKNPVVSQSCLGPALKAAFTVMKNIGGKMCVFQSIMPNLGDGALKPREQPGIMGTPNEIKLLRPEVTWYKDTAVEFSRQQISVDMFLFPYQYMDLASLGELPKYTAGRMRSYVSFNRNKDGPRFEQELNKALTETTAFEAVMRIRCTKGMKITNFFGNFYIRGTDLLALPNCNTESVFGFDLVHDEQSISSSHVTVQAALLYTSSDGERRIRVMTQALPVTSLTSDVVASIDADTCCALMAKQALQMSLKSSLDNARMRLQQTCVEMIRTSKGGDKRVVSGYSAPPPPGGQQGGDTEEKPIPDNLKLLPLYTLAMMKNVAFRGGTDVHPDERVQAHHLLMGMWVPDSKHYIYPRMFAIHEMDDNAGHPSEDATAEDEEEDRVAGRNCIWLPPMVSLSVDCLTSDGVYLLDTGVEMLLWVGRSADMNILGSLFGCHSLDDIDTNQVTVATSGDPFASRFGAIVNALRENVADPFVISPKITVIREGDAHMEARFFWLMVEDRATFQGGTHSYKEFMEFVQNPAASSGSRGAPPGPPGGPPGPQMGMSQPMSGPLPPQHMPPQQQGMPGPPRSAPVPAMPPMGQQHGMPGPPSGMQQPPMGGHGMPPGPPSGMQQQQHAQQHAPPPRGAPPVHGGPPMGAAPGSAQPPMHGGPPAGAQPPMHAGSPAGMPGPPPAGSPAGMPGPPPAATTSPAGMPGPPAAATPSPAAASPPMPPAPAAASPMPAPPGRAVPHHAPPPHPGHGHPPMPQQQGSHAPPPAPTQQHYPAPPGQAQQQQHHPPPPGQSHYARPPGARPMPPPPPPK